MSTRELETPVVHVISGATGASGAQLVQTALAQFPNAAMPVEVHGGIRTVEQVQPIIARAARSGGFIAHTLVDDALRRALVREARKHHVHAVDLMGPILTRLRGALDREPLGQPGLYRQLQREYFERVGAIEYTVAHDDGLRPEGWDRADVVLTGVSRTGKTPLSMYLAVLGWKVANVPLVLDLPAPEAMLALDPRRVVGLTIRLDRLLSLRKQRLEQMGLPSASGYVDLERMEAELHYAARLCRQHGYRMIDVSDRPIESTADEIIRLLSQRHLGPGQNS